MTISNIVSILSALKPTPMDRLTLSFPSVFDLHDFRRELDKTHTEARVNHLTGYFSVKELEIATKVYKAELIKEGKE